MALGRQKDVREQSQRILDHSKTFGNHPSALVDKLKQMVRLSCCSCYCKTAKPFKMLAKHPMLARFEDEWPVEDLASQYLENRAAYLKEKGEVSEHSTLFCKGTLC
jgi:hypothetical protein